MAEDRLSKEEIIRLGKRNFFPRQDRKISDALSGKEQRRESKDLVRIITEELDDSTCLLVPRLIGEETPAKNFWKYAKEVELPQNVKEELRRKLPSQLMREAFQELQKGFYIAMALNSYVPGFEGVRMRIPFVALLDGDRLWTYAERSPSTGITVDKYNTNGDVKENGGKFVVSVPSRTVQERRHSITLEGVPSVNCRQNHIVWSNMKTVHDCPIKRYTLSYRYKTCFEWDEHEVAAYLATAHQLAKRGDIAAIDYSPVLRPTQLAVDLNRKLEEQVLVEKIDKKGHRRKNFLTGVERELFLINIAQHVGLDQMFIPLSDDMGLREYL